MLNLIHEDGARLSPGALEDLRRCGYRVADIVKAKERKNGEYPRAGEPERGDGAVGTLIRLDHFSFVWLVEEDDASEPALFVPTDALADDSVLKRFL